jgi:hypothetical protein
MKGTKDMTGRIRKGLVATIGAGAVVLSGPGTAAQAAETGHQSPSPSQHCYKVEHHQGPVKVMYRKPVTERYKVIVGDHRGDVVKVIWKTRTVWRTYARIEWKTVDKRVEVTCPPSRGGY